MESEKKQNYIYTYIPPSTPIHLKKRETYEEFCQNINKNAPFGRDENGIAYLNLELRENQTYEEYILEIEKTAPFGRDKHKRAHIIPLKKHLMHEDAWRIDMAFGSDHGKLHNSGLGWKLNPTMLIAILLILPSIIGIPLLNLFYGTFETFIASLIQEFSISLPILILVFILVLFIRYTKENLEALIKPYEKNSKSVRLLFINELEYLKFVKQLCYDVYSMKWLYWGFIGFLLYQPVGLANIIIPGYWQNGQPADIPYLFSLITIPSSLLYGLIIVMIFAFIIAIFSGLFSLGNLGKDRTKLSIYKYGKMISNINKIMLIAVLEKKKLRDIDIRLDLSGRTFYEFQRGNRKIGEYLFNIATILIIISIATGIALWVIDFINIFPAVISDNFIFIYIVIFIFGMVSLGIFILPQFTIHRFLKRFKYKLVDRFASLISRMEYLYFEALKDSSILPFIDDRWKQRQDLVEDMNYLKSKIEEVKSYGTWSYDFPELMKLILVVAGTLVPLILPFLGISM
ncbi:MAG: hypothetical protein HWN81_09635 [Candidatus Lokiarchaeota archaeon]|nr:hypothetical protein [Candidatus Lokiarchaeota archaeon]